MNLETSRSLVPRLLWLDEAGSTNTELARLATGPDAAGWPDRSVVVTDTQTGGRGRLGRVWVAPPGSSLAISILLRPTAAGTPLLPVDSLGWFPLLAGAAMTQALRAVLGGGESTGVAVKWPNDVLIDGRKVCGILSELLPGGAGGEGAGDGAAGGEAAGRAGGLIIGSGVNLFLTENELPVPTATSLALAGAVDVDVDTVLSGYLAAFTALYSSFVTSGGDAVASGLAGAVTEVCVTLGRRVRVELPGGAIATGTATGLDETGRLVVARSDTPTPTTLVVSAGDVTHLRHSES